MDAHDVSEERRGLHLGLGAGSSHAFGRGADLASRSSEEPLSDPRGRLSSTRKEAQTVTAADA